jgi:thymidylate kinase
MEIVASIVDDLTKAKERAARKVSARLTPILKDMATTANWPSDIVFQLDIDIDQIMHRENFGSELYEKEEFQKNIRNHYKIFEN